MGQGGQPEITDVHMWPRLRRGANPLGSPDSPTQLCDLSPPSQPLWASVLIGLPHARCHAPGLQTACHTQSGLSGPSVLHYLTLAPYPLLLEFLPHLDSLISLFKCTVAFSFMPFFIAHIPKTPLMSPGQWNPPANSRLESLASLTDSPFQGGQRGAKPHKSRAVS